MERTAFCMSTCGGGRYIVPGGAFLEVGATAATFNYMIVCTRVEYQFPIDAFPLLSFCDLEDTGLPLAPGASEPYGLDNGLSPLEPLQV
jgi:hypothetical protein